MTNAPQLGPFELGDEIGEGGMGTVYRARHVETGQPVAVKVLLADVAREEKRLRDFRREVQALAKLHHPSIAAILDYGQIDAEAAARGPEAFVDGAPWFAMEYVDGDPMPKRAGEWQWETLAPVLLQTLDALAHAHARSIVHRDLKPENILVAHDSDRRGPDIQLVDFGIARIFDPEVDESDPHAARVAGTPKYMAPEQIRGEWRNQGPWTDLYALGCLTWRIVCGGVPFDADTTDEILKQHLRDRPANFEPAFAVPAGLEEWLQRLLDKPIDRRTRRAADAAWQLLELGSPEGNVAANRESVTDVGVAPTLRLDQTLSGLADTVVDPGPPTRAATPRASGDATRPREERAPSGHADRGVPPMLPDWRRDAEGRTATVLPGAGLQLFALREVPVADRSRERDRLWETLRAVRRDGGMELVTLEGGPGTGKTRLAEWFCRRVHETGAARILRATHTASAGLDDGLRSMIRRAFRTTGLSRPEVFGRLLQRLPGLETDDGHRLADARALTELLRPTDDSVETVAGPRYHFSAAHQKYALIRRLFERASTSRPLVVWFDDLQWGGGAIGVLEKLAASPTDTPPVVAVATVRSDLAADDPDLERRLEDLWESAGADRIELEPLASDDHRALIDRLLALDADLADRLAERTEGNPLFAIQLLRDLVDRGLLEAAPDGFRLPADVELDVPPDIHRLRPPPSHPVHHALLKHPQEPHLHAG